MKGYIINIEQVTKENVEYRNVLYTTKNSQLVVMSLPPGQEIGEEVHKLDQFIRFEMGEGKVVLDGVEHAVGEDMAVVIPQGTRHNVINTGDGDLKLYTVYAPPEHRDGIVEHTKADEVEEHFDGMTTE
ncbi:MAG: cupin domain-containing protein [Minisyncoccota bacterium]